MNDPKGALDLIGSPAKSRRVVQRISPWWEKVPRGELVRTNAGDLVMGDALETLVSLAPGVADIVFLDPPFNLGKGYGRQPKRHDSVPEGEYRSFIQAVLEQSVTILKPGGSLYLYHLPRWALEFGAYLQARLEFVHWIAISMKNGFVRRNRLYPAHYALLHFSKGTPASFNRPKVPPLTCPHCGEYVRSYGGYERFVRDGINLSDVWEDVSPVRHARYKLRNANALPPAIPHRVVEMSGRRRGLLVDPFAGTGSSLVAARLHAMRFVGSDSDPEAFAIMSARLSGSEPKE
ncbi:MAG: site-specific DNA-methyltransferase [Acidobacteriota bacterium]